MPNRIDIQMETLFLLMNTPWQEKNKDKAIAELDSVGVDGVGFYRRNGAVVDRYYAAFERQRIPSAGAELLAEADDLLRSVYLQLLRGNPGWVGEIASVNEEDLSEAVRREALRALGGPEDLIAGLESFGIPDQVKWRAMLLLEKPRQQLTAVFGAVRENIPAARGAQAEVAGELGELFTQFEALAANAYGSWPLDLSRVTVPSAPVIPTLAMPCSVFYLDDGCYCGLLCYKLFQSLGGALSKEELLVCAKALSDKSKLEILLSLREESLYGLAIAERMGLTPATVSHHMGTLLAAGLVELEKRGGRVYYRLSGTGVQKFLSGLGKLLL